MTAGRSLCPPLVAPDGVEHRVADLTAIFGADVTLDAAQRTLAQHDQWLPIDGDPAAALGKLVELNSTGPLRLGYGAWRDLLMGAQFRNGTAELITAGGQVIKNVAGYDLTKFMVGQHGLFGRIVTVSTRTYRRPECAVLATFDPDIRLLNALLTTTCKPAWSLLTSHELLCGYHGDERAAEFFERTLPTHGARTIERTTLEEDCASRFRQFSSASRAANGVSAPPETYAFRASMPPSRIVDFVTRARLENWVADPAFGIVPGATTDPDALRDAAGYVGGTVTILNPDRTLHGTGLDHTAHSLVQRLKAAFDPDNTLGILPARDA